MRWMSLRFHLGMLVEVEVQPVGERVHELLQPGRAGRVLRLQHGGVDEELHPQILIDSGLAFRLRQAPHRVDVVRLDAIEIVLGLGVLHAEDRVGVGFSVDVRDAPIVADDGDIPRPVSPSARLPGFIRLECESGGCGRKDENERLGVRFVLHG